MIDLNVVLVLPALAPAIGAVLVLIVDAVLGRTARPHYLIALVAIVVGGLGSAVGPLSEPTGNSRSTLCLPATAVDATAVAGADPICLWRATPTVSGLQLAVLFFAAITLLLAWPGDTEAPISPRATDVPARSGAAVQVALVLSATAGATAVAAAADLGSWLVALELATLPVIALVATSGGRRAVAGAVQLLLTSVTSFALTVLGVGLWYAATGSPLLTARSVLETVGPQQRSVLTLAVVSILAGLAFKLSLVPFHAWTPTAYSGASPEIAMFLAVVSKIAALTALIAVLAGVVAAGRAGLLSVAVLSVASLLVGNLAALVQRDPVRLLAWSAVAQAGWVVLPLISPSGAGTRAAAGYLITYVVATAVAFAAVAVVTRAASRARPESRPTDLSGYRGLVRIRPLTGIALLLALCSLAGLPPGMLGLVGKIVALRPVIAEGWWPLAVIAAIAAVLGVAVYLRWALILLERPAATTGRRNTQPVSAHLTQRVALALALLVLVVGSAAPQVLLALAG